jgi:hypothetical protein
MHDLKYLIVNVAQKYTKYSNFHAWPSFFTSKTSSFPKNRQMPAPNLLLRPTPSSQILGRHDLTRATPLTALAGFVCVLIGAAKPIPTQELHHRLSHE